jgi:hypothetical protein
MKTAVEWLVQEINKLTGLTIAIDEPCVEQAKEMEKEQIKEAYLRGIKNYDPTFKSE